jgi:hypothetical protein
MNGFYAYNLENPIYFRKVRHLRFERVKASKTQIFEWIVYLGSPNPGGS